MGRYYKWRMWCKILLVPARPQLPPVLVIDVHPASSWVCRRRMSSQHRYLLTLKCKKTIFFKTQKLSGGQGLKVFG